MDLRFLIHICCSAQLHEEEREQDDYYATHPKAVEMLLELEEFSDNILRLKLKAKSGIYILKFITIIKVKQIKY